MKITLGLFLVLIISLGVLIFQNNQINNPQVLSSTAVQKDYWLLLHRKSNQEFLYQGIPGSIDQSTLIRSFTVKTGIPNQKPTPLPKLLGRDYWLITDKFDSSENPETAPYFLALDIPVSESEPYGPIPYEECNGQCNWILPGAFGLHGVNSDPSRISTENPGSSGCIRHLDEDITFLYNLLDPKKDTIRYYVEDQ